MSDLVAYFSCFFAFQRLSFLKIAQHAFVLICVHTCTVLVQTSELDAFNNHQSCLMLLILVTVNMQNISVVFS